MDRNTDRNIEIMGIINLTDDSFFAGSRVLRTGGDFDPGLFLSRLDAMLDGGADVVDLGACSTRPGSESVSEDEEWKRLSPALSLISKERPGTRISIDTFRPGIASRAFDIVGPFIVNDVSGGSKDMWELVGRLGLTYVAMHTRGTPKDMQERTDYEDVVQDVLAFFEDISRTADSYGVRDWILDPGFGFAKTAPQNWQLLGSLQVFRRFDRPLLVGLSRKSFLYRPLGIGPEEALPATSAANLVALEGGADILRVHDVAAARQVVGIYRALR